MKQTDILKQLTTMRDGEKQPVLAVINTHPQLAAVISKLKDDGVQPRLTKGGNRELIPPNTMAFRQQSERTMNELKDAEGVQQILPDIELSAQILISSILSPKDMVTVELNYNAPEGILPNAASMEIVAGIRKHFEQTYKIENSLSQILRDVLFDKGAHILMVLPENSLDEFVNRHAPFALSMESFTGTYTKVFDSDGRPKALGILGDGIVKANQQSTPFKLESLLAEPGKEVDGRISLESYQKFDKIKDGDNFDTLKPVGDKAIVQDDMVFVTDNVAVLSMPRLAQAIQEQRVHERLNTPVYNTGSLAMESLADAAKRQHFISQRNIAKRKVTDRELQTALFKGRTGKADLISSLRTQHQLDRKTIGNPLVMELPTEATIPVHVPGQPENHIGYFVLLDNTGHPISIKSRSDYYSDLAGRMGTNIGTSSLPSQVIARTKSMMGGFDCSNSEHLNYSAKVYQDLIIADLLARLRNGVYTNGVELGKNDDVYRIMFARTLMEQRTQLLFVPIELVTYFAFRFNADGIGRSLLSDTKIINALRSTLMFANTMAAIRNSIGMTDVKLKLDAEDPDPVKTVETMMNEVVRGRQQAFPLNTASPADIVYQLQRAGYQFSYDGHPGLPDVQVEFGERSSNYPKPDTELEESLRKRSIMAYGLNPESVDTAFSGEFATTVTQNNILLTRRVMQIQDQFTPLLTQHQVKYIRACESLMTLIEEIILNHYDKIKIPDDIADKFKFESDEEMRKNIEKSVIVEYLIDAFLKGFEVTLPRPTATSLKNQLEEFQQYTQLLDLALDAWLNKEFFDQEMVGDISGVVEPVRASVRGYYIRKWFTENGILPELADMTAQDSEGNPKVKFWGEQKTHIESLMKALAGLTAGLKPMKEAVDKAATQLGVTGEAGGLGGGFGGDGGFGGGTDTGLGGGSNDLGFGGSDDLGLGGETSITNTEESSTSTNKSGETPEGNPEGKQPGEEEGGDLTSLDL